MLFSSKISSSEISYLLQMFNIYRYCHNMTPIIITLSLLIPSKQDRINSGTDLGTGYGLWFSYPTVSSEFQSYFVFRKSE